MKRYVGQNNISGVTVDLVDDPTSQGGTEDLWIWTWIRREFSAPHIS